MASLDPTQCNLLEPEIFILLGPAVEPLSALILALHLYSYIIIFIIYTIYIEQLMSIITVRDGLALMPKLVCSYLDMQTTLSHCLMQGDLPIQIRLSSNRDRQVPAAPARSTASNHVTRLMGQLAGWQAVREGARKMRGGGYQICKMQIRHFARKSFNKFVVQTEVECRSNLILL